VVVAGQTEQHAVADLLADAVGRIRQRRPGVFRLGFGQHCGAGRPLADALDVVLAGEDVRLVGEARPFDRLGEQGLVTAERLELFWPVAATRRVESGPGPARENEGDEGSVHTRRCGPRLKGVGSPRLDGPVADVLDAAPAVRVVGVETVRAGLRVE